MTISELKKNRIVPFEIDDITLQKIFSYFLHKAPSISSAWATKIPPQSLDIRWENYLENWDNNLVKFYADIRSFPKSLIKLKLEDNSEINKKSRAITCVKIDKNEKECECLLRHLRNSIAHGNVFLMSCGNRKFILFEDFNKSNNKTATILFTQTDLMRLMREIKKIKSLLEAKSI